MSLQNWVQQATSFASNVPFRYVALDPGSDTLGVAMCSTSWQGVFTVHNAATLHGSRLVLNYTHYARQFGDRAARIYALRQTLGLVYDYWQPQAVIAESPYYSHFADAFAALTECKSAIRESVYGFNPSTPLRFVDPTTAKQAVGVKAKGSTKLDVERAIITDPRIQFVSGLSREGHTEHVYDAIAVGRWFHDTLLDGQFTS